MEMSPGYKRTDVGGIPDDWGQDCIKSLATITTGARDTQDKVDNGEYPFFVRSPVVERINSYSFDGEAVLTAGDGVGTGKIFHYVNGRFDYHQRVYKISDFHRALDGYFFYLYFSTNFYDRVMSMTAKSSVDSVRMEMIADMIIPLPPPDEQRAIAAVLSDVEALITALDRLIAKKRAIKRGAIQQLLTGRTRLPGFSGQWTEHRLGEIVDLRKERVDPKRIGGHPYCIELEHIEEGSGRVLGYGAATEESSAKARFYSGDVLFGRLRSYLRKYWMADRDGVCSTEIWPLIAKPGCVTAGYLFQVIQTSEFIDVASTAYGTHMPRSDWTVVKKFAVTLPGIDEQRAIAAVLSDMDAEIVTLEARRDKTLDLKKGMMQELLTGKTRLI